MIEFIATYWPNMVILIGMILLVSGALTWLASRLLEDDL